jgi:hypothetical protein
MARYANRTPINWPKPFSVPDGTVKVTPVSAHEGDLLTLGRVTTRDGLKQLGVLTDAEQLALWTALGRNLATKGLIQTATAA